MNSRMADIIEFKMEVRKCECCGGNDFEPVWSNQSIVRKSTATYRFNVHVVVCRRCGFCFTSPSPTNEDLTHFYADGLSGYKEISLPYSIENRISVLERYSVPYGNFVEISGDHPEEFHRLCSDFFGTIQSVELSEEIPSNHRNINDIPPNSADVIAHYDVLEHVTNVRDFLTGCNRALKEGGIMVCEVPDVRLYPRNLLLLEFTHVNHFSLTTLATIAQKCGFRLIETSHICSRPFGLLAVFRKDKSLNDLNLNSPLEFIDTLSCVKGGIEQINRVQKHIKSLRERITELNNKGKKLTLWGVTDLLRHLLDNFRLPNYAVVVDSDPRRKTHLQNYSVKVFEPKKKIAHIQNSALIAIFAPRYKTEIVEWIVQKTGKRFSSSELQVVGSGPSGESLC